MHHCGIMQSVPLFLTLMILAFRLEHGMPQYLSFSTTKSPNLRCGKSDGIWAPSARKEFGS